jgi:hypothetical protein
VRYRWCLRVTDVTISPLPQRTTDPTQRTFFFDDRLGIANSNMEGRNRLTETPSVSTAGDEYNHNRLKRTREGDHDYLNDGVGGRSKRTRLQGRLDTPSIVDKPAYAYSQLNQRGELSEEEKRIDIYQDIAPDTIVHRIIHEVIHANIGDYLKEATEEKRDAVIDGAIENLQIKGFKFVSNNQRFIRRWLRKRFEAHRIDMSLDNDKTSRRGELSEEEIIIDCSHATLPDIVREVIRENRADYLEAGEDGTRKRSIVDGAFESLVKEGCKFVCKRRKAGFDYIKLWLRNHFEETQLDDDENSQGGEQSDGTRSAIDLLERNDKLPDIVLKVLNDNIANYFKAMKGRKEKVIDRMYDRLIEEGCSFSCDGDKASSSSVKRWLHKQLEELRSKDRQKAEKTKKSSRRIDKAGENARGGTELAFSNDQISHSFSLVETNNKTYKKRSKRISEQALSEGNRICVRCDDQRFYPGEIISIERDRNGFDPLTLRKIQIKFQIRFDCETIGWRDLRKVDWREIDEQDQTALAESTIENKKAQQLRNRKPNTRKSEQLLEEGTEQKLEKGTQIRVLWRDTSPKGNFYPGKITGIKLDDKRMKTSFLVQYKDRIKKWHDLREVDWRCIDDADDDSIAESLDNDPPAESLDCKPATSSPPPVRAAKKALPATVSPEKTPETKAATIENKKARQLRNRKPNTRKSEQLLEEGTEQKLEKGTQIRVLWRDTSPEGRNYYPGKITGITLDDKRMKTSFHVHYKDRRKKWHDLRKVKWRCFDEADDDSIAESSDNDPPAESLDYKPATSSEPPPVRAAKKALPATVSPEKTPETKAATTSAEHANITTHTNHSNAQSLRIQTSTFPVHVQETLDPGAEQIRTGRLVVLEAGSTYAMARQAIENQLGVAITLLADENVVWEFVYHDSRLTPFQEHLVPSPGEALVVIFPNGEFTS